MSQRFTVQRFAADGGFTAGAALLLVVSTFAAGAILGALAGFVSQWFYLVLLFPVFIGAGVGAVSIWAIKVGRLRNALIAGASAFLAGCVAMLVMHYCGYMQFRSAMQKELDALPPEVAAIFSNLPERMANLPQQTPQIQMMVAMLQQQEPLALEAWLVHDFPSYMDLEAHSGVRIGRATEVNRDLNQGMNLGYVGSYIYWGVEVLIVAGIAFGMAAAKAREPFCTQCNAWKEPRVLGSLHPPAASAIDALQQGDLILLAENHPNSEPGELMVTAHVCPGCSENGPVDVKVEQVTKTKKGETKKQLTLVTYPGSALSALAGMFSAPPPPAVQPTPPPAA